MNQSKIHSIFCFKILFEYINDVLKCKICKYAKNFQKKIGFSTVEFINKNINLQYGNYLIQRNVSYNTEKNILLKKYNDFIFKYQHIEKNILDRIIYSKILNELSLLQKKNYPHSIKEIQVYSPFFDQLKQLDIMNNLYIYIPLELIEKDEINEINSKLKEDNCLNIHSICLSGQLEMLLYILSKIDINFEKIKNLEIEMNNGTLNFSLLNEKILKNIFHQNLVSLKLDFHFNHLEFDTHLFIINKLPSLKNLALIGIIFNVNFLLSIQVDNLYIRDCLNFGFESNKVLISLKTLEIIRGKIINKFEYELPNVEKLVFNIDLDFNYNKFKKTF